MKFKYYMHDSKGSTVEDCVEVLQKQGKIKERNDIYNHPLYEKLFI